jgi:hypothetical protein
MRPSLQLHGKCWNGLRKYVASNRDCRNCCAFLGDPEVEYLIVGGFAVMKYGEPRYTKDLDVWVRNSAQNSALLVEALARFGPPLDHDGIDAETEKQVFSRIGVVRARIDILTEITGVEFSDAWSN